MQELLSLAARMARGWTVRSPDMAEATTDPFADPLTPESPEVASTIDLAIQSVITRRSLEARHLIDCLPLLDLCRELARRERVNEVPRRLRAWVVGCPASEPFLQQALPPILMKWHLAREGRLEFSQFAAWAEQNPDWAKRIASCLFDDDTFELVLIAIIRSMKEFSCARTNEHAAP